MAKKRLLLSQAIALSLSLGLPTYSLNGNDYEKIDKPKEPKPLPKEPTHRNSNYRAWQKEHRKRLRAKRRKARR